MLGIDTETTGLDLFHGCKPFMVTICDEDYTNYLWTWDVDPLTREPQVVESDLDEIEEMLAGNRRALANTNFDVKALGTVRKELEDNWEWELTEDVTVSGHLLASNHPHNLTDMVMEYLAVDVRKYEKRLEKAVKEAQKIARDEFPEWRIAEEGMPEIPSAKSKIWKNDLWLPRAVAKVKGFPKNHLWWSITEEYANTDSTSTLALALKHEQFLKRRKLQKIYRKRMETLPVTHKMRERGMSISKPRLYKLREDFTEKVSKAEEDCSDVADEYDYELKLPKGGNNNSLLEFVFDVMGIPVVAKTPKGSPSLDSKNSMPVYQVTLEGSQLRFINALASKRKGDTHIGYLNAYERFWIPLGIKNKKGEQLWYCIHPSLNMTGSDTLRWSSSNPNSQNVSKKGEYNLRRCFGPRPGREWWSLDCKNVELRLPAYKSGEQELIDLFERPDDPPYYGSEHLLNFSTVYPDIWEKELRKVGIKKVGPHCKEVYKDTWYQWCKNGDFAVAYGAIDKPDGTGTADRAFHRPGSHARLKERFANKEKLNQECIRFAEKYGYVETFPDRTADPERGYPLLCTRTDWGGILQTVPLNYVIQGTACWVMMRMMIEVQKYLDELNGKNRHKSYLIAQIHDEILLDLPKKKDMGNLPIVMDIKAIMDDIGNDLVPSIPLPVGAEYHPVSWASSTVIA